MAEERDMNNIDVRSETVYDASHWGEENVYIFPPNYKTRFDRDWETTMLFMSLASAIL